MRLFFSCFTRNLQQAVLVSRGQRAPKSDIGIIIITTYLYPYNRRTARQKKPRRVVTSPFSCWWRWWCVFVACRNAVVKSSRRKKKKKKRSERPCVLVQHGWLLYSEDAFNLHGHQIKKTRQNYIKNVFEVLRTNDTRTPNITATPAQWGEGTAPLSAT